MDLKISRILHAGYVFECDGISIVFDPIFENPFSQNCYAYPSICFDREQIKKLKFDAIFISHYHDDHCSLDSLDLLDRQTPIYIYCLFEELAAMIRDLGFTHVYQLKINSDIQIGPFTLIPRRALDEDVDSLFQIRAGGLNVLNVVDSWIDFSTLDELVKEGPWDLILWPFQTMREIEVIAPTRSKAANSELPFEWVQQLEKLNPRALVPSSCQFIHETWSWYRHSFFPISYRQFQKQVQKFLPKTQILKMNPSVSITLNKDSIMSSSPLPWIQPIGEQDVDYEYHPDFQPTTTAEISKHMPPLVDEQIAKLDTYCREGLIKKYQSLEASSETYFNEPRLWRLSIYDHRGQVRQFYYRIENINIQSVAAKDSELAWTTEVAEAKLYAALENGETLSSMYIRINDVVFSSDIEQQIESVDVMEDPLIRCLFTGAFGAYQRAQLKRIQQTR